MRRPPLLTFLTFNRLGNTIPSLTSLLECTDDFELYLLDNFSQDGTWDFLNSINDPRIVHRERSEKNTGAGILNKTLINRKPDQDWVNYEYDCKLETKNFISIFNDIFESSSEMASLSGTLPGIVFNTSEFLHVKEHQIRLYPLLGFCLSIRYEVMNQLGYVDEVSYGMDIDINRRIRSILNKKTGYALDVNVTCIPIPECEVCKTTQSICLGENICTKYYFRVHGEVYRLMHEEMQQKLNHNANIGKVFCDTVYNPNTTLTAEEQKVAWSNYNLTAKIYDDFLLSVGKG